MHDSQIVNFLNFDRNSRLREKIFKYALFHDIKLAACLYQTNLKIYEPEVDNEGCDIILEDGLDFSRKIQLKSIYHTKTKNWLIHKSILLPAFSHMSDYGLDSIICPTSPGAVILISAKEMSCESEENCSTHNSTYPQNQYEYLYTDINIIFLIKLGVIKKNKLALNNAEQVITFIQNPAYFDKIKVSKNLFVKVNGTISLLKLLGFCREFEFLNHTHKYVRNKVSPKNFYKSLADYNPYEYENEKLMERSKKLDFETNSSLKILIEKISDLIL